MPGKMVEAPSCSWTRFFNASRLAHVAGKTVAPSPSAAPPSSGEATADSFHAQSPAAFSSSLHPRLRGEAALLVFGDLAGLHVGEERIPVEAEVGRDAGILRDAQVVLQEELIDGGHGPSDRHGVIAAVDDELLAGDERARGVGARAGAWRR